MTAGLLPRFLALQDLLAAHQALWRPAPFHEPEPAWCRDHPELAAHLLALDDARVAVLASDNRALIELAGHFIPALAELHGLIELPHADARLSATPFQAWYVPGRKQAQIEAFAGAVGEVRAPLLEWCAGKGHLGRLLGRHWRVPVTSLEWDAELCAAGAELAHGVDQAFLQADALAPAAASQLPGHHAIALHACGDLHLALLRGAVAQGVPALDLAPCCYYRIATPEYRPLIPEASLALSRDELHLAVTETGAAGARERRLRDTAQAWKLAFLELRLESAGIPRARPFASVPGAWLADGFVAWMRRLAAREGLVLAPEPDWTALESRGQALRHRMARLELLRLAFRRPLELWLVLERALFLERAGYRVRVAEFCPRQATPRNLLISARRP